MSQNSGDSTFHVFFLGMSLMLLIVFCILFALYICLFLIFEIVSSSCFVMFSIIKFNTFTGNLNKTQNYSYIFRSVYGVKDLKMLLDLILNQLPNHLFFSDILGNYRTNVTSGVVLVGGGVCLLLFFICHMKFSLNECDIYWRKEIFDSFFFD